ncbi:pyridoxamine 5'-phosphate oxidase family protein [Gluconacetobacter sacchari]|uniref:Pyridoxamine 5'-phosphate oxidase family protein n=2 Tax=Gluconacetobacter sacchari TaxID=92759 RepID=A0A7W4NR66_9PROT|nr:pyridoxamine 5'-phosphate oxidase family protein [Gluconacetobacter sacchari]MBB2159825.1 pyridoxamine 5'-phosphate oxidase family protein [Gluconacetobacter sacchari]GBQ23458.1 hypothetical protein AA12717_1496 [Gluconacetobacter sacchari DSM 12717]
MSESFPVTERSRIRRAHERGSHERAAVYEVLDASPLCHVGYVIDGAPYVTPTLQWRVGDRVYWHGSAASRFLRAARGTRVCLTCSRMDGYVMARSAFSHSVNYRSAMLFGTAVLLEGEEEIAAALRDMVEDFFPGRWEGLRPMTAQERRATAVLRMDIEEASVKVRDAPPGDGAEGDYPVWAGVIPIRTVLGTPCPAPELPADVPLPPGLAALVASGRLRGGSGGGTP